MDVDEEEEDEVEVKDYSKFAAYNLSALYMYSGSPRLARAIARKWLSV